MFGIVMRGILRSLPLLALAACTNPVDQHGNLPPADKVSQIKPGTTDKATVTQLLGSPSSIAAFDGNTWYYISAKMRPEPARLPAVLDQQVVAVHFDKDGIVSGVDHRTLADAETVVPNPNATPAPGREFTLMEQLIGNFGKFTANDKGDEGP
jgi:outer membrane protein assembly factor BamE (lipoprotein component of BamABCDE complex)